MKPLPVVLALTGLLPARAPVPPAVGPGTTFTYLFDLHGQHAPFELTIARATDTLALAWRIRGLAGGTYLISPAAWQHATHLNFAQPVPGLPVRLPDSQTFMLLSKSAFADLLAQHRYQYDNTTYTLQATPTPPLLVHGQPLEVLHVTAEGDPTELWILNNPDFPVICQLAHNPLGINFTLSALK